MPVVYTDFLSMYPTVNSLMGLWRFVTARKIEVVDHCQTDVQVFLEKLTADDLFNPATWKELTAFVRIIPNGDILPSRGKYSAESKDWQVGLNHLYAQSERPNDALWFSLPDVVGSRILYGRVPQIVDAFRIVARGKLDGLQATKLRGAVQIDPKKQDFFRMVIEERKRLAKNAKLSEIEKKRLDKTLKVLANAASYGIYGEMIREESDEELYVTCHGIDAKPHTCRVAHPDKIGEYAFRPSHRLSLALPA